MDCPHGFPKPENCVDCMNEGNLPIPPAPSRRTVEAVFRATYEGHCQGCNFPIRVGELIARLSDDSYVHDRMDCRP